MRTLALIVTAALVACGGSSKKQEGTHPYAVLAMTDGVSGLEPYAYRDGQVTRLADIAAGSADSSPRYFEQVGARVVFCARDEAGEVHE